MTFVISAFVRMLKLLGVVLIVSFLTFMLTKLLPGSPVNLILGSEAGNPVARAALEDRLGLNEPIWRQYLDYLYGVFVEHDLGYSYLQEIPTTTYLSQRLPGHDRAHDPGPVPVHDHRGSHRALQRLQGQLGELTS